MTKEEILAMEIGEDLDRLVATEVMGEPMPEFIPEDALDLQLAGSPIKSPKGNWLCLCDYDKGDIPTWRPLPYATDISAAWQVEEKIKELGLTEQYGNKIAIIVLDDNTTARQRIFDAAHASPEMRCKAALLAKLGIK